LRNKRASSKACARPGCWKGTGRRIEPARPCPASVWRGRAAGPFRAKSRRALRNEKARFGRIAGLQGPPREGPESAP
jgi:hypothetical protein